MRNRGDLPPHRLLSMNTRVLILVAGMLATSHLIPVPVHAQQPVDDPLTLFAKMMPVLSHERCVNCHGATNPYTGDYHPSAVSRNTPCVNCHTASPRWDTAPPAMSFFRKTTRQLCQHFEMLGPSEALAAHLQVDDRIGLAFVGRRGN